MMLLPPKPGSCPACGRFPAHDPKDPHDAQSLYYQYSFYGRHGRWPTWADAVAHCDDDRKRWWREELSRGGHWSEPPEGIAPIADPPSETLARAIGDPNDPEFKDSLPVGFVQLKAKR
jgi:hypothetical protein